VSVGLRLIRMNRDVLSTTITIPDELSSLVLKTIAWKARLAPRDAVDIRRCAEVMLAGDTDFGELEGKTGQIVRAELRSCVARRDGIFMRAVVDYRHLSAGRADALHTRLRAVVDRLLADQE